MIIPFQPFYKVRSVGRETLEKTEFIYTNLCIYSYMFKLKSPSEYSPFDAIHLIRTFFSITQKQFLNSSIFLKDFIYLFLERGEAKEKEKERNINVWLPLTHTLLGIWPIPQCMCPDWELNW